MVCACSTGSSQIDTLVLVDRTVDPLTPFCTQLTYEGLIDETFHIKNGVVQLEAGGMPYCLADSSIAVAWSAVPCCCCAYQIEVTPKKSPHAV